MMMMVVMTMKTVMLRDLLVPQPPPAYVLIHLGNTLCFYDLIFLSSSLECQVWSVKCIKTSLTQYLPTIPEYEYLSSSPPSSITELDWEGSVRSSTSSELRMGWTCLDNPHCWDKSGESEYYLQKKYFIIFHSQNVYLSIPYSKPASYCGGSLLTCCNYNQSIICLMDDLRCLHSWVFTDYRLVCPLSPAEYRPSLSIIFYQVVRRPHWLSRGNTRHFASVCTPRFMHKQ